MKADSPTHLPIRREWLDMTCEPAVFPEVPVIDSHHHLYLRPDIRYLLDEFESDLACGHDVRASVIVQARAMLNPRSPSELQPLGETEFANGIAAMSASGVFGRTRVGAGIVGYADLRMGKAVRPILERHMALAGAFGQTPGRFRGVRQSLTWDPDAALMNPLYPITQDMMDSDAFREGFSQLAPLGLNFDAWVFFHQLPVLARLARDFPSTSIVLDHCGGIIGTANYQGRSAEVHDIWLSGMKELAQCPNVYLKLSGLGMKLGGFGLERLAKAPGTDELVGAWKPWMTPCLELFGSERCMYGSNFPVDKGSSSYGMAINAIKTIVADHGDVNLDNVMWKSCRDFYRLNDIEDQKL